MKKTISLMIICFIINITNGQEKRGSKSKMLDFASKTGVIVKFEDYNLLPIKSRYSSAKTKIRKIISGSYSKYFFQISKKGKSNSKTASIAYEDLIEVIKAIVKLKEQSSRDIVTISDYLENKFITEDGFRVGYYFNKAKIIWYIQLDSYSDDNTLFIKDIIKIEEVFKKGKEKIEKLKG